MDCVNIVSRHRPRIDDPHRPVGLCKPPPVRRDLPRNGRGALL